MNRDVHVVGVSCRYAGRDGVQSYWDLLTGKDTSPDRSPGPLTSASEKISETFSSIDEEEADMAIRLVRSALDDSSVACRAVDREDIGLWVARSRMRADGRSGNLIGPSLAKELDIRGPVVDVDVECASALAAVAAAWTALRSELCRVAIVVAVRFATTIHEMEKLQQLGVISPTQACLSFDVAANGYVVGEGGGAIVMTFVDDEELGSYGRIVGAYVANLGSSCASFSMGLEPMIDALSRFARRAQIEGRVGYVEAHAVGSRIGDEMEVVALERGLPGPRPIRVGAVKRLIGHLEAASGMAALQKVLLAAKHDLLPPTSAPNHIVPHFRNPNSRTILMIETGEWDSTAGIALVNSVAQSGTMAFVAVDRPTRLTTPQVPSLDGNGVQELRDSIRSILVECLPGFIKMTEKCSFFQLGMDSVKATIMAHQISKRIGIAVSPVLLFDKHTFEPLVTEIQAYIRASASPPDNACESSFTERIRKLEAILLSEPSRSSNEGPGASDALRKNEEVEFRSGSSIP